MKIQVLEGTVTWGNEKHTPGAPVSVHIPFTEDQLDDLHTNKGNEEVAKQNSSKKIVIVANSMQAVVELEAEADKPMLIKVYDKLAPIGQDSVLMSLDKGTRIAIPSHGKSKAFVEIYGG